MGQRGQTIDKTPVSTYFSRERDEITVSASGLRTTCLGNGRNGMSIAMDGFGRDGDTQHLHVVVAAARSEKTR